jgi:hypothetical protein
MDRLNNSSDKFEIKFACGHAELRVTKRDSFNKIAIQRAARMLCCACLADYDAKRKRLIEDSIRRANEASKSVKLTGSRKQIEWAERIRDRWLFDLQRDIPQTPSVENAIYIASGNEQAFAVQQAITSVLEVRLKAIEEVLDHGQAAWWIDWRYQLNERINKITNNAMRSELRLLSIGQMP